MSALRDYFSRGHSVDEIASTLGLMPTVVRETLRAGGVALPDAVDRDAVTEAARKLGYASFAAWIKVHGPEPMLEQARQLGVSRGVLNRLYDAYRAFLASTSA